MSRRIYLASSWRNEHQPRVLALLREAGHEVYDFRNPQRAFWFDPMTGLPLHRLGPALPSGFSWHEVDPAWRDWTPEQYIVGLHSPRAEDGYTADFNAMRWCNTCVALLPSGPSAALEAGWCRGSGRDLVVHVAGLREPDLMYRMARTFTTTDDALLAALAENP